MRILELDPQHQFALSKIKRISAKIASAAREHFTRGERYYKEGEFSKAEERFRRVLALQPHHLPARRRLGLITRDTSDRSQYYYDAAKEYASNKNWQKALAALDSALIAKPDFEQALELRNKTLDMMDVDQLIQRAKNNYLQGQYIRALANFNQALEKQPEHTEALNYRELCIARLNDLVDEYFNRGLQLYTEEKYQLAISEWEKALEINPDHKGSLEYKRRAEQRQEALKQLN
jgi:tetratricopeptide (TPR) repeat protein